MGLFEWECAMKLEWESDYDTGNEYVDLQHRYFLNLIKRVGENFKDTDDLDYIEKLIGELRKYADFHFTSEENIATSLNLQGVSAHHRRHQELLVEFNHHAELLNTGSKSMDEFLSFLTDWFVGHTVYEDQNLFS